MNILFATQTESLNLFSRLHAELAKRGLVDRAGFTICHSGYYEDWLARNPDFGQAGHTVLKEWEVTAQRSGNPDLDRLRQWEEEIGGKAGLFGAIVADRRLLMGPDCVDRQDYRRRFTDEELLSVLEAGCAATERVFDTLKPDLVIGHICVTMLDYLVYLFAKARGIRYMNVRMLRVGDCHALADTLKDPPADLAAAYARVRCEGSPWHGAARDYIDRLRNAHSRYDGAILATAKPIERTGFRFNPVPAIRTQYRMWREYSNSMACDDNHVPNPLRQLLMRALLNPLRAWRVDRALRPRYVTPQSLAGRRFAFFPLHTEPEIALLVYGRPFVNQIEAIRQFAFSLPADMLLVVKEHPWMVGKRSLSAYRKMLNIPKVHLAPPEMEGRDLAEAASMITTINSTIGLEAAILRKPVACLGDAPFTLLPENMVRLCGNPMELPTMIADLLRDYACDEKALTDYLAASMEASVPIKLQTVLLHRTLGREISGDANFEEELGKLADYVVAQHAKGAIPHGEIAGGAAW